TIGRDCCRDPATTAASGGVGHTARAERGRDEPGISDCHDELTGAARWRVACARGCNGKATAQVAAGVSLFTHALRGDNDSIALMGRIRAGRGGSAQRAARLEDGDTAQEALRRKRGLLPCPAGRAARRSGGTDDD
ncbi:hypothetical protein K523DRAFT_409027, partial [Schizophyllum commune Tattone D]